MLFVARGFRIALLTDDGFSKLLAAGLTFSFALQTFIIVGGIVRLIPLTGITLPFVSYGGSSIVANFIGLALLLLVSNQTNACERPDLQGRPRRPGADHRARRRHDVLADWAAAGLADRQDNAIQRVAQFKIKRGLILTERRALPSPRTANGRSRDRSSSSAAIRTVGSWRRPSATRRRGGRGRVSKSR